MAHQTLVSDQAGTKVGPALVTFVTFGMLHPGAAAGAGPGCCTGWGFHINFLLFPQLDVAIDGADEVDTDLNLIKGGG